MKKTNLFFQQLVIDKERSTLNLKLEKIRLLRLRATVSELLHSQRRENKFEMLTILRNMEKHSEPPCRTKQILPSQ